MTFDTMHKAIIMIDSDLIEAADAQPEKAKPTAFKPWMKYAVAAVLIAVFAIGTPVALNMAGVFGTNNVVDPASTGDVGSYEEPDPNEAHGGSCDRDLELQYVDKCVGLNYVFVDYFEEKAGMDIDTWLKTVLKTTEDITNGGIFEEIAVLGITKDEFIRLNETAVEKYNINNPDFDARGRSKKEIYDDYYCYTDEEIDIIYSGDKKRIAEVFAQPFAIIADDWEIYTLDWIIKNPATLYKEKHISLEAIETAVDKWLGARYIEEFDERKLALLARIEEYRKMQ